MASLQRLERDTAETIGVLNDTSNLTSTVSAILESYREWLLSEDLPTKEIEKSILVLDEVQEGITYSLKVLAYALGSANKQKIKKVRKYG